MTHSKHVDMSSILESLLWSMLGTVNIHTLNTSQPYASSGCKNDWDLKSLRFKKKRESLSQVRNMADNFEYFIYPNIPSGNTTYISIKMENTSN